MVLVLKHPAAKSSISLERLWVNKDTVNSGPTPTWTLKAPWATTSHLPRARKAWIQVKDNLDSRNTELEMGFLSFLKLTPTSVEERNKPSSYLEF